MDTAQWPQGIGVVKPMEESRPMVERRARPHKNQALNCPRCNSTDTKFCYYNNYSLSQPRYFCKTCRRYWTEGGSLRNVPVGGGSRKNKRSLSSVSPASSNKLGDLTPSGPPHSASQNPKIYEGQDLNLAYPPSTEDYNGLSKFLEVPYRTGNKSNNQNSCSSSTSTHLNAMELQKTGMNSRGFSSFMSMSVSDSNTVYSKGFSMQDFKPPLNFPLDGFETGYGNLQGVQEIGARLLFPMEELKQVPSTSNDLDQKRGQGESTGYWSGMLGGGHW